MSAEDYRIKVGFLRHHKTKRLRRSLGAEGILALLGIWEYAAEFRSNGRLTALNAVDIELIVDWSGPEKLIDALVDAGFIDDENGVFVLHEWSEHNPWASDSSNRSDAARLSRLFSYNPKIAQQLKDSGRKGISSAEFDEYKTANEINDRSTTVTTSVERFVNGPLTPAPAPAPAPKEEKNNVGNSDTDAPPSNHKKPPTPKFTDDDMAVAKAIYADLLKINPKHKTPNWPKWADCIRLMRGQDGRTHDEIRSLWAWAHQNNFWRGNILSPETLRKKWDRLVIQRNTPGRNEEPPARKVKWQ